MTHPVANDRKTDKMSDEQLQALQKEIELDFNGNYLTPSPTFFIGCGGMGKIVVNLLKKNYTWLLT